MLEEKYHQLQLAQELRSQGALEEAKTQLENLVADVPQYHAALHILGLTHSDLGDLNSALTYFARATAVLPDSYVSHAALATIYVELGHLEAGERSVREALLIKPDATESLATLAQIHRDQKDYKTAYELLKRCVRLEPSFDAARVLLGIVCLDMGLEEEMVATVLPLTLPERLSNEAVYLLSSISRNNRTFDLSSLIDSLPPSERQKPDWFFAKAGDLQRNEEYEQAWKQFEIANSMVRKSTQLHEARYENWERESLAYLYAAQPIKDTNVDKESPNSLYILGPSRSGKTTMERTVQYTGGITLGFENQMPIKSLTRTFLRRGLPPAFQYALLPRELYNDCRTAYLTALRAAFPGADAVTFTSPSRIHDAYQIAQIVPNSYFVFVRRDPVDTAIRIFQKHYASGNYYAYDWKKCLDHVKWYNEMIDRLLELLPNQSTEINYQDLGSDSEHLIKKLKKWLPDLKLACDKERMSVTLDTSPSSHYAQFLPV